LTEHTRKILVYGYGNPGRQDDGLGVMLADELEKWITERKLSGIQTDTNYQLNLEDVSAIESFDTVIFADASKDEMEHFRFERLEASELVEFSMHAISPGFVLHLCNQVYSHQPVAYLLHIRGYEWEFMEAMTDKARENLALALDYLKDYLLNLVKPDE
jgi:hydrogenase maturation protease